MHNGHALVCVCVLGLVIYSGCHVKGSERQREGEKLTKAEWKKTQEEKRGCFTFGTSGKLFISGVEHPSVIGAYISIICAELSLLSHFR